MITREQALECARNRKRVYQISFVSDDGSRMVVTSPGWIESVDNVYDDAWVVDFGTPPKGQLIPLCVLFVSEEAATRHLRLKCRRKIRNLRKSMAVAKAPEKHIRRYGR